MNVHQERSPLPCPHAKYFSYFSLHFSHCPIEIRDVFAAQVYEVDVAQALYSFYPNNQLPEFVLLKTCNRFDIFLMGPFDREKACFLMQTWQPASCGELSLRFYADKEALEQLMRVAAGIDSLIMGEQQILGQMKDAFLRCGQMGYAGNKIKEVFSKVFQGAKKIRHETPLCRLNVSVGSATVQLITRIFSPMDTARILILGAGAMARLVGQHLITAGAKNVSVANRSLENAAKLSHFLGCAWPKTLEATKSVLADYDVVISTMGGPEIFVDAAYLKSQQFTKKRFGYPSVWVDLSVPRKFDPKIAELEGVFLFHIDDLQTVVQENQSLRLKALPQAEKIIAQQTTHFFAQKDQRENLCQVGQFHQWLHSIIDVEVDKYLQQISKGKTNRHGFIAHAVAKKVVSHMAQLARQDYRTAYREHTINELVTLLFNVK